jgi:hypothetical protein
VCVEGNERADRLADIVVEQGGTAIVLTFLMSSGKIIKYQMQQMIMNLQL